MFSRLMVGLFLRCEGAHYGEEVTLGGVVECREQAQGFGQERVASGVEGVRIVECGHFGRCGRVAREPEEIRGGHVEILSDLAAVLGIGT